MPLVEIDEGALSYQPRSSYEPEEPKDQDKLDLWAAGMALQNPISGAIRYGLHPDFEAVPGYNPLTDEKLDGYDPEEFAFSQSPDETRAIKQRIDHQQRDRQMLAEDDSLHSSLSSIAGYVGNPLLWAPMLLAPQASVPAIIAAETGAELTSEFILHQQQPERTLTESAINVGAAAVVSGILGTAAQTLSKRQMKQLDEGMANELKRPPSTDSAGAQRVNETTIEDETLVGGDAVTHATIGPLGRVMRATSLEARKVAQQLADLPFILRKHEKGKSFGPSVEARMGRFEATEGEALNTLNNLYKQHAAAGGKLSEDEFFEAVTISLRSYDKHAVKEVELAADYVRKNVFNPTKYEAQNLKLLPEDREYLGWMIKQQRAKGLKSDDLLKRFVEAPETLTKDGASYAPRVYDYEKLAEDLQGFKKLITDYLQYNVPDGELVARDEAEDIAESVIRNVFLHGGLEDTDLPKYLVPKAGALQERTIDIPDMLLEPYLVNDSRVLISRYLKQIGSDIELTKVFGSKNMRYAFSNISTEYDRLIAESTGAEAKRLKKERSAVFRDLKAMRDRLTGQYERPMDPSSSLVKSGASIRAWNTMTMLGGAVVSNLPDMARPIMELGLRPFAKGMTQIIGNVKGFNLSRAELKRWGVGLDMTTGSRMAAIADAQDMMQAGQQKALNVFGKVSLLNAWNGGMKQFAGVMIVDSFLKWGSYARLTKHQNQIMARAGLDENMLVRINEQFRAHGITDGGLRIANTAEWTDAEAAEIFEAAVRSEVQHTIIQPGVGDKPLVASTEVGKLAFQFQSFIMSAQNRMLINGLQRHDMAFMTGILASVFIGMLTAYVKNAVRGKEQPKNPQGWIAEGVDRSGVLGLMTYPFNWGRMATGDTPSRFAARNITGTFLGPTPEQAERAVRVGLGAAEGNLNPEQLARLMPFQNLLHLRQIGEQLVE
ncbi:hypothetical protein A3197_09855 [Candidatus Thiodiazotropha endoloripes]|nr:hypothetical protein A3197_09855 [Candidatus Thiodiazotropha endoloripes]